MVIRPKALQLKQTVDKSCGKACASAKQCQSPTELRNNVICRPSCPASRLAQSCPIVERFTGKNPGPPKPGDYRLITVQENGDSLKTAKFGAKRSLSAKKTIAGWIP